MSDKKHAVLSPSAARRWMRCPGSVWLSAHVPDDGGSVYADEGTLAHAQAEAVLTGKPYPDGVTGEMADYVRIYTDYVESLGGALAVETTIDLSEALQDPSACGTADAVVWRGEELWVVDLKYGMNVVYASHNPQLALYADGYMEQVMSFDTISTVHLVIVQPRLDRIDEWTCTPDELTDLVSEIRRKALIAKSMSELGEADQLFAPSPAACKYCRAAGLCKALGRAIEDHRSQCEDPVAVTPEELAKAYEALPLVKTWSDAVDKAAYTRLMSGGDLPGYKLVEGRRGPRKWADEIAAAEAIAAAGIAADVWERKLVSPAKLEKLIKGSALAKEQYGALEPYMVQEPGKPTIAKESDKRAAWCAPAIEFPSESKE